MKRLAAWVAGSIGVAVFATVGVLVTSDRSVEAQQAKPNFVQAYDCTIQLKDIAILAAERPGILDFVEPEEGDPVRAGKAVAGLKDGVARATYEKELEKAKNDVHVRYAQKSSEVADAEYAISLAANEKVPGTVPLVELQKLQLAAQKARLQIEQAEFEKRIAELTVLENLEALKTYQVIAEFDGIVSKVFQRKGEAVQQGSPILEVLSTTRVRIEGYISISDSTRIKAGDTVQVQLDAMDFDIPFKEEVFTGKVKFVDPHTSPIIGSVKLYAEVENPRGVLRPGLNAKMVITPSSRVTTAGAGK